MTEVKVFCSVLMQKKTFKFFGEISEMLASEKAEICSLSLFIIQIQPKKLKGEKSAKYDSTSWTFAIVDSECNIYLY
jgi:hypothetical protein